MENTVTINNQSLPIKEYNGQRVVTFKDIDTVHERTAGTAGRSFRGNKKHFIENVDYFKLQSDEIRRFGITSPNGGYLITETGYLMLVKSFTDDLAWTVQRELVNSYFRAKEEPKPEPIPEVINPSNRFYPEKATSIGEIVNLIKLLRDIMKAENASAMNIAQMTKTICEQFGIELHYSFVNWDEYKPKPKPKEPRGLAMDLLNEILGDGIN